MLPLELLIEKATTWVSEARATYQPLASPLSPDVVLLLRPYFEPTILESARVLVVPELPNPPFYSDLVASDVSALIDFSEMDGLTLIDTILVANHPWRLLPDTFPPLLFHELVHVTQYSHLSTAGFLDAYVRGWDRNGRNYRHIPLEEQAYALQARFEREHPIPFSVSSIVGASQATT